MISSLVDPLIFELLDEEISFLGNTERRGRDEDGSLGMTNLWDEKANQERLKRARYRIVRQWFEGQSADFSIHNLLEKFGYSPEMAEIQSLLSLKQVWWEMLPRIGAAHQQMEWRVSEFWGPNPALASFETPQYLLFMKHLLAGTHQQRSARLRNAWLIGFGQQIEFLTAHGCEVFSSQNEWMVNQDLQLYIDPPAAQWGQLQYQTNLLGIINAVSLFFVDGVMEILLEMLGIPDSRNKKNVWTKSGPCPCMHCLLLLEPEK